jgi:hypothetical protein
LSAERTKSGKTAGYSGTPLAKKLGIGEGAKLLVVGAPGGVRGYGELVAPLPTGVTFAKRIERSVDLVHLFVTERARLVDTLVEIEPALRADAAIWVSWPKKASKFATDITEETIRDVALPMGLVDVKVCAVDAIWSGLKLVIRKENRSGR